MGFLKHDDNTITIDAVLTSAGRKFLAANDGSFSIVKFALGDDEVPYDLLEKFGKTVGKEKIEKNVPIFEAITNTDLAQKSRLISLSNPNITRLPTLQADVGSSITLDTTTSTSTPVKITQSITAGERVQTDAVNQVYEIKVPRFFQIPGVRPRSVSEDGVQTYFLTRNSSLGSDGGSSLDFKVERKSAVSESQFNTYGITGNKNRIRDSVTVRGLQDGSETSIEVNLDRFPS
jgi:hypothetical protein